MVIQCMGITLSSHAYGSETVSVRPEVSHEERSSLGEDQEVCKAKADSLGKATRSQ